MIAHMSEHKAELAAKDEAPAKGKKVKQPKTEAKEEEQQPKKKKAKKVGS